MTRSAGSGRWIMAVTYGVDAGGHQLAVTALELCPGGSIPSADLTEALADLPGGEPARHRARGAAR